MKLNNPQLMRHQAFIDGEWLAADNEATITVVNPSTGTTIGQVPRMGKAETRRAIEASERALPAWRELSAKVRANALRRWCELIIDNQHDLAHIMTLEQGKPLPEALGEIVFGASYIEWYAEEAKRVYGDLIPGATDKRLLVIKQPVGVCAAITPWNFPSAMITRKAGPALAAGCTMVIKPASQTPFSALALVYLAEQAGIPKGVLSVVTGAAAEIAEELTSNPAVRKISFTGSTEIGRQIMEKCAHDIKKVSLELGGNAPFIVFEDADLDAAVDGALASKFRNAGQTCVCANRLYVHDKVYDAFVDKLASAVGALKVGDGFTDGVTLGPLIDGKAVAKVREHIEDALAKGAKVVQGVARMPRVRTSSNPPSWWTYLTTPESPRKKPSAPWRRCSASLMTPKSSPKPTTPSSAWRRISIPPT